MLSYVLPDNPGVRWPADQATRMAINDLGVDTYHDVLTHRSGAVPDTWPGFAALLSARLARACPPRGRPVRRLR
jgi:hypothetical protein